MAAIAPPSVNLAQIGRAVQLTITYAGINTSTDLPADLIISRRYESEVSFNVFDVVSIKENGDIILNDPIQEIGLTQYRITTKNRNGSTSNLGTIDDSITTV
jgi:hypothetical protein